jgi:hypothetical protein
MVLSDLGLITWPKEHLHQCSVYDPEILDEVHQSKGHISNQCSVYDPEILDEVHQSKRSHLPTNVEYVMTLKSWMRFISRIPVEERLCWDPQKGAHNNGSQINLSWLFLVSNWVDSLIGWSKWAPISSLPPHFPIPVFSVLWVGVGKKKKGKEVTETWMWKKYFAGPHTYFAKRCWRWLKWHLGIW